MPINISICVLTYNRCESLRELLAEIVPLSDESTEIIVVDNHSEDETSAFMSSQNNVRYFRTSANIGASGRNVAFENARGSIIICLDDDIFGLTKEIMATITERFRLDPLIGAINFKVIDAFNGNTCNWVHHCKCEDFHNKEFLTYEITEGAVAFRKEALNKSGYYDDMYFISNEGPDLALRIMNEGYDCIFLGDLVVKHKHENSGHHGWLNYYYDTRNHILFAVKNLPIRQAIRYLSIGIASTLVYSLRDNYIRYWAKAIIDGLAHIPSLLKRRKVLPKAVIQKIKQIDQHDAPILYKIKSRLFRQNMRL